MKHRVVLKRLAYLPTVTLGRLIIDDEHEFFTVERPWLNNKPFISCIPQGVFRCERYSSAKYPNTFEVVGVHGRSKILFHVANFADDVQGCIGVGESLLSNGLGVAESRLAMEEFKGLLADCDAFDLELVQFRPEWP